MAGPAPGMTDIMSVRALATASSAVVVVAVVLSIAALMLAEMPAASMVAGVLGVAEQRLKIRDARPHIADQRDLVAERGDDGVEAAAPSPPVATLGGVEVNLLEIGSQQWRSSGVGGAVVAADLVGRVGAGVAHPAVGGGRVLDIVVGVLLGGRGRAL